MLIGTKGNKCRIMSWKWKEKGGESGVKKKNLIQALGDNPPYFLKRR